MDDRGVSRRDDGIGAQEGLLLRVGVGRGKRVVLADDANGGIDAVPRLHDFIGQVGAVAVADHVRAPFFRKLQGQFFIARFAGKGKITLLIQVRHVKIASESARFYSRRL